MPYSIIIRSVINEEKIYYNRNDYDFGFGGCIMENKSA